MTALPLPVDPDVISRSFKALRVQQPIGDIFIASVSAELIQKIAFFDVRRVLRDDRDLEKYLGIQRPLSLHRVDDIKSYVRFADASFPTSMIIAIDSDYVSYDEQTFEMTISNTRAGDNRPSTSLANLARVIDGQHRIAGLENLEPGKSFDVIVSIFVGSDISDQAYIFATVNLEQTKVNKSLAYDLFELARTRSPFRTCHNIAVALDTFDTSPFFERIKRLGVARLDRPKETLTQATFVDGLIRYVSDDPKGDRDALLRGSRLREVSGPALERLCFRNLFIAGDDVKIGKIYEQYFLAVEERWSDAWKLVRPQKILNRTNGYRALSSLFGRVYSRITQPGNFAPASALLRFFERVPGDSDQFDVGTYPPGTSGESALRKYLSDHMFPDDKLL
jgi:DGQHR domain-containing protein